MTGDSYHVDNRSTSQGEKPDQNGAAETNEEKREIEIGVTDHLFG